VNGGSTTSALLRLALALDGEGELPPGEPRPVRALQREVERDAERGLSACRDANDVERVLRTAVAAIELSLAAQALDSADDWRTHGNADAARLNVGIARTQLLRAAGALSTPVVTATPLGAGAPLIPLPPDPPLAPSQPGDAEPDEVDVEAQRNIAAYHREHERYYARQQTEHAAQLYREANVLKVLAGVWLEAPGPDPRPDVDTTQGRYHPVASVDLNSRHAIAHVGVLYMEGPGELEPSELIVMKTQLRGSAAGAMRAGRWLAEKAQGAWQREQSLSATHSVELAAARLVSICTNWRASRFLHLSGRVLTLGLEVLARQDLSREGVRKDRGGAARTVLNAAWIITMAGSLQARCGMDLSESDRSWTAFLEGLDDG
jgi:hypothetical protein